MVVIARIKSDFPNKFGVPRQSGLVESLNATVIFESEYRNVESVRGLERFSHIWLIWGFSETDRATWSPTVRPPRLGGNKRMGVFATRSPYRPNPIALSSVKLVSVSIDKELGPVLHIAGADLMDGSPIYDIKPYLSSTDCHCDAVDGFAAEVEKPVLKVTIPDDLAKSLPDNLLQTIKDVLSQDPRPAYQHNPERIYGMNFAGYEIKFSVNDNLLTIISIIKE